MSERTSVRRYRDLMGAYLAPQKTWLIGLTVILFCGIGLRLALPQIAGMFLDDATTAASLSRLLWLAVIFCVAGIGEQALSVLSAYAGALVSWRATNRLREDLMEHCLNLDLGFHHAHSAGEMIERVDGDARELNTFFSELGVKMAGNLLLIIGILGVMLWENWQIGLVFLFFTAVAMAVFNRVRDVASPYWVEARAAGADLYSEAEDWMGGLEDVRANGAAPFVHLRFANALRRVFHNSRRAIAMSVIVGNGAELVLVLGATTMLGLGALLYLDGTITIGTVFLITMYTALINRPLQEIIEQIDELQQATGGLTRIEQLRALRPAVEDGTGPGLPDGPLSVEFDAVGFGYRPHRDDPDTAEESDHRRVLHDVSFRLEPGEVLGLVGRTGSGKSTLVRLLSRLYDPDTGVVRLGGRDLRDTTRSQRRHRIGVVSQEIQLLHATLRDNLTLYETGVDDDRLVALIHELGLGPWFTALPDGLDTVLTGNGDGMSTGESQLLAMVRIFITDPGLVILDEPTSRLDPATERRLEAAVDRLFVGRTGVVVAHRLNTLDRVDTVITIDAGRIVEHGRREQLADDPDSLFHRALHHGLDTDATAPIREDNPC